MFNLHIVFNICLVTPCLLMWLYSTVMQNVGNKMVNYRNKGKSQDDTEFEKSFATFIFKHFILYYHTYNPSDYNVQNHTYK